MSKLAKLQNRLYRLNEKKRRIDVQISSILRSIQHARKPKAFPISHWKRKFR